MQTYELVAVHDLGDPKRRLLIRADDFDPATHKLWGTPVVVPVPEGEPAPATRGGKRGGKAA